MFRGRAGFLEIASPKWVKLIIQVIVFVVEFAHQSQEIGSLVFLSNSIIVFKYANCMSNEARAF